MEETVTEEKKPQQPPETPIERVRGMFAGGNTPLPVIKATGGCEKHKRILMGGDECYECLVEERNKLRADALVLVGSLAVCANLIGDMVTELRHTVEILNNASVANDAHAENHDG